MIYIIIMAFSDIFYNANKFILILIALPSRI